MFDLERTIGCIRRFTWLKFFCALPIHLSLPLNTCNHSSFYCFIVFTFPEFKIDKIRWCVSFKDQFISFSNLYLNFLHIFVWLYSSLFLELKNILLSGCISVYLSIYLLKKNFIANNFLAIINKPVTNSHTQVFVWTYAFVSLGLHLWGGWPNHVVGECQTITLYESNHTFLHPNHQWMRTTVVPNPC